MCAGTLGDNAVERYTLFLTSVTLAVDPSERRTALQRAREHGLDVPRVAIVTAEHTIARALVNLKAAQGPDTTRTVNRVDSHRERDVRDGAVTGERYPEIPARRVVFPSPFVAGGVCSFVL